MNHKFEPPMDADRRGFFGTEERQRALLAELESWKGTRFWPRAGGRAKKGVGADCVSFVQNVLVNTGAIQAIGWPKYVISNGGWEMFDLLTETLAAIPTMEIVWRSFPDGEHNAARPELIPGDVFLVSQGANRHHLGIFGGDQTLWHCTWELRGVGTGNIHDPLVKDHTKAIYRVMDSPQSQREDKPRINADGRG